MATWDETGTRHQDEAAIADGRRVRDVVGDDLPTFAAVWAQAGRRRPWLEPVLGPLAAVTLVPAGVHCSARTSSIRSAPASRSSSWRSSPSSCR